MELVFEFLRKASECLELSRQQPGESMREQFLVIARWWLSLAAAREQTLKFRANSEKEKTKLRIASRVGWQEL